MAPHPQAEAAVAAGAAASAGGGLVNYLLIQVIEFFYRLGSTLLIKAWAEPFLGDFTRPEYLLNKILPDEEKKKLDVSETSLGKLEKVKNFINFLKEYNLRFADFTVLSSIIGPHGAYVAGQISSAYQWSYGLGWLSWIGTGQILTKVISEPLSKELDYYLRGKLLTEAAALELWRKGLIKDEELKEYLAWHGYDDEKIDLLMKKEALDIPSGTTAKLIQLGFIDKNEVIEKLKKAGLTDEQAELYYLSSFREPSDSLITKALASGLIDKETAKIYLRAKGYDEYTINLILAASVREKTEKDMDLSKSEILQCLRFGIINEAEARSMLRALGYDENEITWLINLEKAKIARGEKTIQRDLSKSEILRAYQFGILSQAEVIELLSRLGYDKNEINVLLQIAELRKAKEPKERKKEIAKSDILKAFRLGIIDENQAKNLLRQLGFAEEDIELILKTEEVREETRRTLTPTQVLSAIRKGIISKEEGIAYLKALGYGDYEIDILLKLYTTS